MVKRLAVARPGLRFTLACSPQGSAAAIDPRRTESLREAVGPKWGLWVGETKGLDSTLAEEWIADIFVLYLVIVVRA